MNLLDTTYKTTRYAIPLKTNVDNQVLTTFVIENESSEKILETLNAIKSWNPSMNLRYGIADFYDEEIDVLESFFSGKF